MFLFTRSLASFRCKIFSLSHVLPVPFQSESDENVAMIGTPMLSTSALQITAKAKIFIAQKSTNSVTGQKEVTEDLPPPRSQSLIKDV